MDDATKLELPLRPVIPKIYVMSRDVSGNSTTLDRRELTVENGVDSSELTPDLDKDDNVRAPKHMRPEKIDVTVVGPVAL